MTSRRPRLISLLCLWHSFWFFLGALGVIIVSAYLIIGHGWALDKFRNSSPLAPRVGIGGALAVSAIESIVYLIAIVTLWRMKRPAALFMTIAAVMFLSIDMWAHGRAPTMHFGIEWAVSAFIPWLYFAEME
jgi:hypothetical protein